MRHWRILRLFALAAISVAAFVGTTPASAAKFTAGKVGATLSQTTMEEHRFTITGSTARCNEVGFTGKTEALESETMKITPSYSGCTVFGFTGTVTNNKCEYTVSASDYYHIIGLGCSLTFAVNNVFAKCKAVISSQSFLEVEFVSDFGRILGEFDAFGVSAEVTESSGLCPLTVGKHTNAIYEAVSTIQASGTEIAWDV